MVVLGSRIHFYGVQDSLLYDYYDANAPHRYVPFLLKLIKPTLYKNVQIIIIDNNLRYERNSVKRALPDTRTLELLTVNIPF